MNDFRTVISITAVHRAEVLGYAWRATETTDDVVRSWSSWRLTERGAHRAAEGQLRTRRSEHNREGGA